MSGSVKQKQPTSFYQPYIDNFVKLGTKFYKTEKKGVQKKITIITDKVIKNTETPMMDIASKKLSETNFKMLSELSNINASLTLLMKEKQGLETLEKYGDKEGLEKTKEKIESEISQKRSELSKKYHELLEGIKSALNKDSLNYLGDHKDINLQGIEEAIQKLEEKQDKFSEKVNTLSKEIETLEKENKTLKNENKEGSKDALILEKEKALLEKKEEMEKLRGNMHEAYEEAVLTCNKAIVAEATFLSKQFGLIKKDWQALKKILNSTSNLFLIHERIVEHFQDPKKAQSVTMYVVVSLYAMLLKAAVFFAEVTPLGLGIVSIIKAGIDATIEQAKLDEKAGLGKTSDKGQLDALKEEMKSFLEEQKEEFSEWLTSIKKEDKIHAQFFNAQNGVLIKKFSELDLLLKENFSTDVKETIEKFHNVFEDLKTQSENLKTSLEERGAFVKNMSDLDMAKKVSIGFLNEYSIDDMPEKQVDNFKKIQTTIQDLSKEYREVHAERMLQKKLLVLHDKISLKNLSSKPLSPESIAKEINKLIKDHRKPEGTLGKLNDIVQDLEGKTSEELLEELLGISKEYQTKNNDLRQEYDELFDSINILREQLEEDYIGSKLTSSKSKAKSKVISKVVSKSNKSSTKKKVVVESESDSEE